MNANHGHVVSIHISPTHGDEPTLVDRVRAVPGKGLEGDRHFDPDGHNPAGEARDITLIEVEQLGHYKNTHNVEMTPAQSRRNIATSGVRLNDLVDKTFHVGPVQVRGVELCEPCGHLSRLTHPTAVEGLLHRAGLRARIVTEGHIRVGDPVIT